MLFVMGVIWHFFIGASLKAVSSCLLLVLISITERVGQALPHSQAYTVHIRSLVEFQRDLDAVDWPLFLPLISNQ